MDNSTENSAPYRVVIPRLGLTMVEASIVEWYAKDGEWVEKGQPLFALENEKATVDIESPASGYLRILAAAGVTLPALTVIAELTPQPVASEERANLPTDLDNITDPNALISPLVEKSLSSQAASRVAASPKARRIAKEFGAPLEQIQGSGMRGMITSADVQRQAASLRRRASPLAERVAAKAGLDLSGIQGSGSHGRILRRDVEAAIRAAPPLRTSANPSVQPINRLRAVIAERLSSSWQERPQVTLFAEAEAVNLMQARRQINDTLASRGEKVSLNALLIKICAIALADHPILNAYIENGQIIQPEDINIGLAVDTERGLIVPVVHQAQLKSLRQINQELNELTQRALQNRSAPSDLEGGTFSITNLGIYEIDGFTPLINPPQTAILGIGRIRPKPAERSGRLVLRHQVTLSLSFDHRLVDGAPAARFLQSIKRLIEHPFLLAY